MFIYPYDYYLFVVIVVVVVAVIVAHAFITFVVFNVKMFSRWYAK